MKRRRGFSLIETMIAVLALSFTVLCFGAVFPTASQLRGKAENLTRATTLAHQKLEQLRGVSFADLTHDKLSASGFVDATPTSSPFSITAASGLAPALPGGTGTLTLTDEEAGLKRAQVDISWTNTTGPDNSITLVTFIADKSDLVE